MRGFGHPNACRQGLENHDRYISLAVNYTEIIMIKEPDTSGMKKSLFLSELKK